MANFIKILLALFLIVCLADMPYGYYQLVRYIALLGFALLAYAAHERSKPQLIILYISLAILFQPFVKIALGRALWNVVDVTVAFGLLASIFFEPKQSSDERKKHF